MTWLDAPRPAGRARRRHGAPRSRPPAPEVRSWASRAESPAWPAGTARSAPGKARWAAKSPDPGLGTARTSSPDGKVKLVAVGGASGGAD